MKKSRVEVCLDAEQHDVGHTAWEQVTYEVIRPVVLFSETPVERAKETGEARGSLYRKVEQFEEQGMVGLFKPTQKQTEDTHRTEPAHGHAPSHC
jgi:hypothetical protein